MRRREFIALVGGAAAAASRPLAARAQHAQLPPRIGYLRLAPASQSQAEENAFRDGMRELG